MEPGDAQNHYSEELALLPGIGTRYENPARMGMPPATRAEFGLPEGVPLLLFPQSLFKIHPDNDDLIVQILARVPKSILIMFAGANHSITGRFVTRMRQAFARGNLAEAGRIKILPTVSRTDYLRINSLCEAMLDSLHWSGGNTSLDALAMGLPVATLPGTFMRGRQSAAMLKRMGLDELIAQDPSGLVDLTSRLLTDAPWRAGLARRIAENQHRVFDDPEPIKEFERFLERAAAGG
jgi:CRISPR-associated protein Csy1